MKRRKPDPALDERIALSALVRERRTHHLFEKPSVDKGKTQQEAKAIGSFYTVVPDIIDYLARETIGRKLQDASDDEAARKLTVCDPACGAGFLLIGAAEYIFAWWARHLGHEVSPEERSRIVREQLYGVDLDAKAVDECRKNLAEIGGCSPDEIVNVRHGNALIGFRETPDEFAELRPDDADMVRVYRSILDGIEKRLAEYVITDPTPRDVTTATT